MKTRKINTHSKRLKRRCTEIVRENRRDVGEKNCAWNFRYTESVSLGRQRRKTCYDGLTPIRYFVLSDGGKRRHRTAQRTVFYRFSLRCSDPTSQTSRTCPTNKSCRVQKRKIKKFHIGFRRISRVRNKRFLRFFFFNRSSKTLLALNASFFDTGADACYGLLITTKRHACRA